jgi:thiol-disulfide isomerase/thioredoxin
LIARVSAVSDRPFLVVCLCAAWCGTCRDYRDGFEALAGEFPQAHFRWLDVEDEADLLAAVADDPDAFDIDNFPTLLIQRDDAVLFYGTMLPHLPLLRRTLEAFRAQRPDEARAYAQGNDERRRWQRLAPLREALTA